VRALSPPMCCSRMKCFACACLCGTQPPCAWLRGSLRAQNAALIPHPDKQCSGIGGVCCWGLRRKLSYHITDAGQGRVRGVCFSLHTSYTPHPRTLNLALSLPYTNFSSVRASLCCACLFFCRGVRFWRDVSIYAAQTRVCGCCFSVQTLYTPPLHARNLAQSLPQAKDLVFVAFLCCVELFLVCDV
jgi:hypothetical protein